MDGDAEIFDECYDELDEGIQVELDLVIRMLVDNVREARMEHKKAKGSPLSSYVGFGPKSAKELIVALTREGLLPGLKCRMKPYPYVEEK